MAIIQQVENGQIVQDTSEASGSGSKKKMSEMRWARTSSCSFWLHRCSTRIR